MADGIRLHHPTERGCVWLVRHPRKDYHLRLDDHGDVIVSTTVFERLAEVQLAGLVYLNVVGKPPTIRITAGPAPDQNVIAFNPRTQRIEHRKVV